MRAFFRPLQVRQGTCEAVEAIAILFIAENVGTLALEIRMLGSTVRVQATVRCVRTPYTPTLIQRYVQTSLVIVFATGASQKVFLVGQNTIMM